MRPYRTLIVEDEPLMREYLERNLPAIHPGFAVADTAHDGLDALSLFEENDYDLVIADIKMPRLDGISFIERLRQQKNAVPVILLSGYDEFEYARAGLRLGVAEYLLKPLNDAELAQALERIVQRIEAERAQVALPDEWTPQTIQRFITDCFTDTDPEYTVLAERAARYVAAHFTEPITQTDVAEALGITPAYLSTLFHEATGESYTKFLTRLRMTQAAMLLRSDPSLTMQSVAQLTGYVSDKHFIHVFKRFFQMTPNEYRKSAP